MAGRCADVNLSRRGALRHRASAGYSARTMSAESDVYEQIYELAPSRDPATATRLADDHWPQMLERAANPHDAETCRLVYLAHLERDDRDLRAVDRWRTRALARFGLLGWREGVAAVMMSTVFVILAQDNDDYPAGTTLDVLRPSPDALDLLAELEPFTVGEGSGFRVGPRSPNPALIARFVHEKRGFLLLLAQRYDEAQASYRRAATAALGSPRGELKVAAGAALVEYLSHLDGGGDLRESLAATRAALEQARAQHEDDIATTAGHNAAVIAAGGRDLRAYEIL